VGRDASPVLDRYPPKDPSQVPRGAPTTVPKPPAPSLLPPASSNPAASTPPAGPGAPAAPLEPVKGLITLDRPFDIEAFSQQLGEPVIQLSVPRENLAELLTRVVEFMGFGIYVYTIAIRPGPQDMLKGFDVELRRVEYSSAQGAWVPFVERGRSTHPFGPGSEAGRPG